jgi:hypothetical protein
MVAKLGPDNLSPSAYAPLIPVKSTSTTRSLFDVKISIIDFYVLFPTDHRLL